MYSRVKKGLGRQVRSLKRLGDLVEAGETVLYCRDQMGIEVFEVDLGQAPFSDVIESMKKERYFMERKGA